MGLVYNGSEGSHCLLCKTSRKKWKQRAIACMYSPGPFSLPEKAARVGMWRRVALPLRFAFSSRALPSYKSLQMVGLKGCPCTFVFAFSLFAPRVVSFSFLLHGYVSLEATLRTAFSCGRLTGSIIHVSLRHQQLEGPRLHTGPLCTDTPLQLIFW